ncbi:MAG TPA: NrsF family protein [Labilithrix sp.]
MNDLRARVLAEVKKTPSPTREEYRRRVSAVVLVGAIGATAVFFATGRIVPGERPMEMILFSVGFALFAAAVLTRLSTGRPGSMLGRSRTVLVTGFVVTAPLLAIAALFAEWCWHGAATEPVGMNVHSACAALTLAQGVLPLGAFLVPKRGSDPVHPVITGAALGMTAGAWSAMMAYLRCPHAASFHCIVAHVGPTLVLAAVGAVLGWAILRVK